MRAIVERNQDIRLPFICIVATELNRVTNLISYRRSLHSFTEKLLTISNKISTRDQEFTCLAKTTQKDIKTKF